MREKNKSLFWIFLAFCTFGLYAPVSAQDDLYYDPTTDAPAPTVNSNSDDSEYREPSNITRRYDDNDEYTDEDDEYAYQYSSRIRRFHQPARVIDYYDPFFVDLYYYDPFFMPGNSIYTYGYNDYWTWRQWRRAQRWNSYYSWGVGPVWSSWGWNSCYNGFNAWSNPWAFNNYYYDPYWTWNGYNPYYGYGNNNWVNNDYYYSNNNGNGNGYKPKTYTGVRQHGSTVNPGYARIADNNGGLGRLASSKAGPVLENPRTTKGMEPSRTTVPPIERTREADTRRPDDKSRVPATTNGRNTDQPEKARPTREDAPRRSETEERPTRNEAPARRNDTETRPRTETRERNPEPSTRPSRTQEAPRTYERPARTEERSRSNDAPSRTQESRPSRNESSPRSFDSGSSSRSSSGSSSSGSSGSSSGGKSSSGSSGGGGSRGRN